MMREKRTIIRDAAGQVKEFIVGGIVFKDIQSVKMVKISYHKNTMLFCYIPSQISGVPICVFGWND